ncbi:PE family protein [Mycobacterium malmoense]|uniref:PE domain-containing protein n=1 Tax=Mycobacterium malmoense TaxID=1780 RepID=A0ABX3SQ62_MYCMA|nr:PE family protein [Mycobacterium malmoense]OIN81602.1 hypothetical protein BMG05_06900 [Mycobacterium malmoense]ORA81200.1 hypothetical protein BST29_14825 [Mycobacterium malmoense]QZA15875.1 PE family protein [Mycobacterium malmoense]
MSFVITTPEIVASAAGNLAGIGTTLGQAIAVASGPTTDVAAGAADEVSTAVSRLFSAYGQQFQAFGARAAAFHDDFVRLLNGSVSAYLGAESANTAASILGGSVLGGGSGVSLLTNQISADSQALSGGLETLLPGLFAPGASAVGATGGPYQTLFANTVANLQSLGSDWIADPFPVIRQVVANQQVYGQTIATALATGIQNLPAELANAPTTIQAGVQRLLAFNPGASLQQFVNQQIGYAQTVTTSLQLAGQGFGTTLPVFQADVGMAYHALATGNYNGAVNDLAEGFKNLFVTGIDASNSSNIKPVGPVGDLLPILSIPGQMVQNFTGLFPTGSVPALLAQNYANVIDALTNTTISTTGTLQPHQTPPIELDAFFGLPLSVGFGAIGPPIAGLNALATSATTFAQAVQTGNGVAALGALVDAPAVVANGFLNGETHVTMTMTVDIDSFAIPVTMSVPLDGILVPPHPMTATVDLGAAGIAVPVDVTVGGTPFSGLLPGLVNYLPQQLANAITPVA